MNFWFFLLMGFIAFLIYKIPTDVGKKKLHNNLRHLAEYAYMKGQVDAMKEDWRIKEIDGDYKWTNNGPFEDIEDKPLCDYYSQYDKEEVK